LIAAGAVAVSGVVVTKASAQAEPETVTLLHNPIPWVSRAALKLAHAIELWDLSVDGAIALDVGASTGGFTEVLLHHGATRVFAVDVGHDQLADCLRSDMRVVNLEGTNARTLPPVIPAIDWIVSDVSFISLTKALPDALSRAKNAAQCVALVKPQFEVGPERVGKGGVVKDAAAHNDACAGVARFFEVSGWEVEALAPSPIRGNDGNIEFLLHAVKR
jgi:23S rRNA (cytidine1920-2'-O)/16S rRNA (cytidine1409-2'-O)-methyltransferase